MRVLCYICYDMRECDLSVTVRMHVQLWGSAMGWSERSGNPCSNCIMSKTTYGLFITHLTRFHARVS